MEALQQKLLHGFPYPKPAKAVSLPEGVRLVCTQKAHICEAE